MRNIQMQRPQREKPQYYPDPVVFGRERLIWARFDNSSPSASNSPIYFDNDDVLRNKIVTGIELFNKNNIQLLTDYGIVATANGGTSGGAYFTLTLVGWHNQILVNQYPVAALSRENTFGKTKRFSLEVCLSKSYVLFTNLTGVSLSPTDGIAFNFHYVNKVQS